MAWAVRPFVRLSVCPSVRLSSVTSVHFTQRVELFGNIFAPSTSLGTRTVVIKILKKKEIQGVLSDCTSQLEVGMKNWYFSTNISLYLENGTWYGHSYNGRGISTRTQFFNNLDCVDLCNKGPAIQDFYCVANCSCVDRLTYKVLSESYKTSYYKMLMLINYAAHV